MGLFERILERQIFAEQIAEEQATKNTCKKCKKITKGDLYPYQKTIFGNPKNYVCRDCAEKLGLI